MLRQAEHDKERYSRINCACYVREGVLRKAIAKDGEIYDAMIYAKVR